MSGANWFIGVGLVLCAMALGGIAYRQQEPAPPPKVELACPAPAAPVINVPQQPAPVVNVETPKAQAAAPKGDLEIAHVAPKKAKPKPRPKKKGPAETLKSKWVLQ